MANNIKFRCVLSIVKLKSLRSHQFDWTCFIRKKTTMKALWKTSHVQCTCQSKKKISKMLPHPIEDLQELKDRHLQDLETF